MPHVPTVRSWSTRRIMIIIRPPRLRRRQKAREWVKYH